MTISTFRLPETKQGRVGNLLPTLFYFFRQPERVLLSFLPQNIKTIQKSPFQRGQQVAHPTLAYFQAA
ncbi:MAG: hypothetical protein IKG79_07875 [Neisseriaceae bacterium]|nr:hypothetical protein [Neisseriaceae bacterium]